MINHATTIINEPQKSDIDYLMEMRKNNKTITDKTSVCLSGLQNSLSIKKLKELNKKFKILIWRSYIYIYRLDITGLSNTDIWLQIGRVEIDSSGNPVDFIWDSHSSLIIESFSMLESFSFFRAIKDKTRIPDINKETKRIAQETKKNLNGQNWMWYENVELTVKWAVLGLLNRLLWHENCTELKPPCCEPWIDYWNPKAELSKIHTDKRTFVEASTTLHTNETWSRNFVHWSDLVFPIIETINEILQDWEAIIEMGQIKFVNPIRNNVTIYAWDTNASEKQNFDSCNISASWLIRTNNWRIINYIVIENTNSPIKKIKKQNLFAMVLMTQDNKPIKISDNEYVFHLNNKLGHWYYVDLWKSRSAQIATIIEILTYITCIIYDKALDKQKKTILKMISKIKDVPLDYDLISLIKWWQSIRIVVKKDKQKRMSWWMLVTIFEIYLPWQTKPTKIYFSHTDSREIRKKIINFS